VSSISLAGLSSQTCTFSWWRVPYIVATMRNSQHKSLPGGPSVWSRSVVAVGDQMCQGRELVGALWGETGLG
jgi:hypothetical protein